jgi:hypothetical protein
MNKFSAYNKALLLSLLLAKTAYSQTFYEERIEGEAEAIQTITELLKMQVEAQYAEDHTLATRDAHAKAHGCVAGELQVKTNLPTRLQTSVFQPGKNYQSIVRYSNGSGRSQDDNVGDGRGMAIKLLNIEPQTLLPSTPSSHDLVMINHPVFFIRNVADYVEFSESIAGGNPLPFFFPGINPFRWRMHELKITKAIQGKDVNNPLAVRYWSMTPYRWGNKPAKFSAIPCARISNNAASDSPNKLRESMASTLNDQPACFDLAVQLQTNNDDMPVEDPTIEWNDSASEFIPVARLTIPKQKFLSQEQQQFCEQLSFTPWRATEDHRPLGGINRARKVVYQSISDLRHDLNGILPSEPSAEDVRNLFLNE